MPSLKRITLWSFLLYFLSQILFLVYIQFPRKQNFDEFHYVPSAKQLLANQKNQNWEHPPLGKELMAVGIGLLGDRPVGWRVMSTVFGALTLVGMFLWALALFRDEKIALWVAALTAANHLLYVQARIGMLDTFMTAFLVWALAAFTALWIPGPADLSERTRLRFLYFTGLMLGLAVACKWAAIVPWMLCIGIVILFFIFQKGSLKNLPFLHWVLALGIVPLLAYALTFLPLFRVPGTPVSLNEFLQMQLRMVDGQLRVVSRHPYMSHWYDWAILRRPIWYAFDHEPSSTVRGVLLLGNPLIMWTGIVAVLYTLWDYLKAPNRVAFLISVFYFGLYLSWMMIPRKICFYYYYYPAGMVLSLALAYFFERTGKTTLKRFPYFKHAFLGLSIGVFVHFLPILSGWKIREDSFRKWMWFLSWI